MLGAAVLGRCSLGRTEGRSLIRMVRAGASTGPALVGGAESSAGAAALCRCVPFTPFDQNHINFLLSRQFL